MFAGGDSEVDAGYFHESAVEMGTSMLWSTCSSGLSRSLGYLVDYTGIGITDPAALSRAATDPTALRLAELQTTPIRGSFDSTHLQAIHHHIYQDLYDWAGELRQIDADNVPASQVEKSLTAAVALTILVISAAGQSNH